MSAIPPARRRLVGAALRRYRENVGYDLADAARVLDCDRSKISRIESGERGMRVPELQALLTEYGVDLPAREALAGLSQPATRGCWWQEHAEAVPEGMRDFAAIEALASSICVYDAHRVPELLQTPGYAKALIDAGETGGRDAERVLAAVLARQRAVLASRPEVALVIAEAALLNVVGGPKATRDQLTELGRVSSDSGHVTIYVLPLTRGTQVAATGPMTIVGIGGVPSLGAVHVPGVRGGICLTGPADVAAYARAFEQLKVYALPPAQSARLLRELPARRALHR